MVPRRMGSSGIDMQRVALSQNLDFSLYLNRDLALQNIEQLFSVVADGFIAIAGWFVNNH